MPVYFCFKCNRHLRSSDVSEGITCKICNTGFIEQLAEDPVTTSPDSSGDESLLTHGEQSIRGFESISEYLRQQRNAANAEQSASNSEIPRLPPHQNFSAETLAIFGNAPHISFPMVPFMLSSPVPEIQRYFDELPDRRVDRQNETPFAAAIRSYTSPPVLNPATAPGPSGDQPSTSGIRNGFAPFSLSTPQAPQAQQASQPTGQPGHQAPQPEPQPRPQPMGQPFFATWSNTASGNTDNLGRNGPISDALTDILSRFLPPNATVEVQVNDVFSGDASNLGNAFETLMNQFMSMSQHLNRIPEEFLSNVPKIKVSQEHVNDDAQCTTCMEMFVLGEEVSILGCKHIFHHDCIIPWLRLHNTCPVCRSVVKHEEWGKRSFLDDDELD